jgi:TfoX/Sxy family transcriptional regulator of competence genes
MAYSEENAGILRDELASLDGIHEQRMFGGLCFLLNGNMLCGVHKEGGMARVGKDKEASALELEGIEPLSFTGRKMGGMVDIGEEVFADESTLREVLSLAREFVESLPAK